jgi:hypothetical protein
MQIGIRMPDREITERRPGCKAGISHRAIHGETIHFYPFTAALYSVSVCNRTNGSPDQSPRGTDYTSPLRKRRASLWPLPNNSKAISHRAKRWGRSRRHPCRSTARRLQSHASPHRTPPHPTPESYTSMRFRLLE